MAGEIGRTGSSGTDQSRGRISR